MAIPKLGIVVDADTTRMETGFERSQKLIRSFAAKASIALIAVKTATVALGARSLKTVDAQAKLAKSLGTTTSSIQVMQRAGELAGVAMTGVEQATKDLTRRLNQAAAGTGPAADALKRLNLSANELAGLPLDRRVEAINSAIERFIPAAQRAAVAGQLFGEEGSIAMSRIDPATIRQAAQDIEDFGVAVSEFDAARIQDANDAISRLSLITRGLGNRMAADIAPSLQRFADIMGDLFKKGSGLTKTMKALFDRVPAYTSTVFALVGAMFAYRAAVAAATFATANFKKRLVRAGIGIFVVALGEAVFFLTKVVKGLGGVGAAIVQLKTFWRHAWLAMGVASQGVVLKLHSYWIGFQVRFLRVILSMKKQWASFLDWLAKTVEATPLLNLTDAVKNTGHQAYMAGISTRMLGDEIQRLSSVSEKLAGRSGQALTDAANIANSAWGNLKGTVREALSGANGEVSAEAMLNTLPDMPSSDSSDEQGKEQATQQSGSRGSRLSSVQDELDRVRESLMTAEELQLQSYERQKSALQNLLSWKTGAQEGYAGLMERIEQTHQFRMTKARNQGVKSSLNALGQVFTGSKKIGAAIAVTNSWLAFTEVLKDPSFIGNPLGRIAAAGSTLAAGFNAVRGIKSGSKTASAASVSGGGGASSQQATSGGGSSTSRNVAISLQGSVFGQDQVRELINQINEAVEGGAVVRLV